MIKPLVGKGEGMDTLGGIIEKFKPFGIHPLDIEMNELWPEISRKITRIRKDRKCGWCAKMIPKGEWMRIASGKTERREMVSTYYCMDCMLEFADGYPRSTPIKESPDARP